MCSGPQFTWYLPYKHTGPQLSLYLHDRKITKYLLRCCYDNSQQAIYEYQVEALSAYSGPIHLSATLIRVPSFMVRFQGPQFRGFT